MNKEMFKKVEIKFNELRDDLNIGEITAEDMRNELKELMIKDDIGNYWMIGGKTGKWYYYNGSKWIRKDPEILEEEDSQENVTQDLSPDTQYEQLEVNEEKESGEFEEKPGEVDQKVEEVESENDQEEMVDSSTVLLDKSESKMDEDYTYGDSSAEGQKIEFEGTDEMVSNSDDIKTNKSDLLKCKICGFTIPTDSKYCKNCGADRKGRKQKEKVEDYTMQYNRNEIEIKKIRLSSLIFLFGGVGIIFGVIFGAIFGVLDIFNELLAQFPSMLQEARGKLQGGLIFGALGGITFSIIHMAIAGILGLIYNILSFILGGIKFKF